MSRKTKIIFIIILLAIACVVIFFAYSVARDRYFVSEEQNKEKEQVTLIPDNPEGNDYSETVNNSNAISEDNYDSLKEISDSKDMLTEITENDCDERCSTLNNQEDIDYCKQVCGITPITQQEDDSDCNDLENLERDYCFRDLAVTKKDFKLCDEIDDKNIWQMCQNRITEELTEASSITETLLE